MITCKALLNIFIAHALIFFFKSAASFVLEVRLRRLFYRNQTTNGRRIQRVLNETFQSAFLIMQLLL